MQTRQQREAEVVEFLEWVERLTDEQRDEMREMDAPAIAKAYVDDSIEMKRNKLFVPGKRLAP